MDGQVIKSAQRQRQRQHGWTVIDGQREKIKSPKQKNTLMQQNMTLPLGYLIARIFHKIMKDKKIHKRPPITGQKLQKKNTKQKASGY
jgi:hypothetical protein